MIWIEVLYILINKLWFRSWMSVLAFDEPKSKPNIISLSAENNWLEGGKLIFLLISLFICLIIFSHSSIFFFPNLSKCVHFFLPYSQTLILSEKFNPWTFILEISFLQFLVFYVKNYFKISYISVFKLVFSLLLKNKTLALYAEQFFNGWFTIHV